MKLYMLLVMWGQIGGYVGPLPYDLAECETRAADMRAQVQKAWDEGKRGEVAGRAVTPADMEFRCVFLAARPQIVEPRP